MRSVICGLKLLLVPLLFGAGARAAIAGCDRRVPTEAAVSPAREALAQLERSDLVAFQARRAEALAALSCQGAPLSPRDAALLLQMEGLDAFTRRDFGAAGASFHAARVLDPTSGLSPELAPPDTLLRALWDDATTLSAALPLPLERGEGYRYVVNGREAESVPTDQPYLLQIVAPDAQLVVSGLFDLGRAPPPLSSYEVAPPPEIAAGPRAAVARGVGISAGAVALGSAGLWTAALIARSGTLTQGDLVAGGAPGALDADQLDRQIHRTNTLGYAAQGSAALALGLSAVAVSFAW